MERIPCRCSWTVYPGFDCDFCGIPAAEVAANAANAETVADVLALPELRTV